MKKYRKIEKPSPEIIKTPLFITMDLKQNNHKHYSKNISYKVDDNSFFVKEKEYFLISGGGFSTFLYFLILFPFLTPFYDI